MATASHYLYVVAGLLLVGASTLVAAVSRIRHT